MNTEQKEPQQSQDEQKSKNRFLAKKSDAKTALIAMLDRYKMLEALGLIRNMSCNEFIISQYKLIHECTQLRTFYDWKKNGYIVQKGEKGLPIFSSPKTKTKDDASNENEPSYFFIAYVFSEKQVTKLEP